MIAVRRLDDDDPMHFAVTLAEGGGSSQYQVTAAARDVDRLAEGHSGEALIEAAFRFLLDREPSDAILRRFDLSVIGRYFPEFENEIARYLRNEGS